MRKIIGFILLVVSINSFGQNPTNYQYRTVRERLISMMADSSFHIPRYNGHPSGVRTGSSTQAGALGLDTINHIPSYYSGQVWRDFQPIRDGLYSGGIVTWDSLLVFTVSAAVYYIGGQRYETDITHITLDAANGSNPRIDLIVATTSGISKITGTAAASPAEANLPIDNIRLTAIFVNTSATTPTGPVTKIIYDENTEFTGAATSVTTDFGNFTDPYHFVKATSAGAVTSASFLTYTGTDFSIAPYNTFKFFVKLKATFAATTRFQITWYKDGVQVSTTLTINSGTYGFIRTSGVYQEITIPVFDFGISTEQVDQVKFSLSGSNGSGFYLDYIQLKGGVQQPTGGLNRFGVSGEDAFSTQSRYHNQRNLFPFWIDSSASYVVTSREFRFKNLAQSNWLQYTSSALIIDPLSTSIPVTINNIPYNSGSEIVALGLDTLTNRLVRKTAVGGTSGIDDVLAVGQSLTTTRTIDVGSSDLIIDQSGIFTTTFGSSGSAVRGTSSTNVGVYGISTDDVAGVAGENSSTTAATIQSVKSISNAHLATPGIDILRTTSGTAINGIGSKIRFITETSTGAQDTANIIESIWSNATHASRESQLNIRGVDNTSQEVFMNVQKDLVRINNNADTLATKAYARSVGGGGGGTNIYNSDGTLDEDRFFELDDHYLEIDNGGLTHFLLDPVNRIYIFGDHFSAGNNTTLIIKDTATVSPRWVMKNVQQESAANILYYNPANGKVSYEAAGGGSGTVNTGASLKAAYYPSGGTTVDDVTGVEFNNTNLLSKFTAQSSSDVIMELRMAASQTADPLVIKNSSGSNMFQFQKAGHLLLTSDGTATLQNADGFDNVLMSYGGNNSRWLVSSGSGYDHKLVAVSGSLSGVYTNYVDGGGVGMETNNALNFITNKIARATISAGGVFTLNGRFVQKQGADVASAAGAIALGTDGNAFEITGTAAITLISNVSFQNGAIVTLLFTSTASLTDGTANSGTDIGMELAGNSNFTGSAGATVTLRLMELGGAQRWYEISRSVQ